MTRIIRYDIIDRHTQTIAGTAKTRSDAFEAVDRLNNAYGAYRYVERPVYEKQEA
jgi:hypothetical protein